MGRIGYSLQRVELMRGLAATITDERSRRTVLDLAGDAERRALARAEALAALDDRVAAQ